LFMSCCAHRDLHSFPTRRSSDLGRAAFLDLLDLIAAQPADIAVGHQLVEQRRVETRRGRRGHQPNSRTRSDSTPSSSPSEKLHRSEEHTSELQSPYDLVCRLLLE